MAFAGFGRQIFAVFVCANFTLASAPVSAKSKLKSQSFDESKFVADEYAPAKKKGRRGPASVRTANRKNTAQEPNFSVVDVDGKKLTVQLTRNEKGRVISQVVLADGRLETAVDKNGDGLMESWEMSTKTSRMELTQPIRGHFSLMTIEHRYPDGIVQMQYSYQPKAKDYKLFGIVKKPYGTYNQEDFVVGCREKDKELTDFATELEQFLKVDSNQAGLKKSLEDELIGPKCKQPPFADMVSTMSEGMMKVALSDRPQSQKGAKKGKYLSCLRHYELDTHANRILGAFGQYTSKVSPADRYKWSVTCDEKQSTVAKFTDGFSDRSFSFNATKAKFNSKEIQKLYGKTDHAEMFAQSFFHEMLHYSKIEDETIVEAVEYCCSADNNEGSPACKEVEEFVKIRKMEQRLTNTACKALEDCEGTVNAMREGMGSSAEFFRTRLVSDAAQIFLQYPNDNEARKKELQNLMDDNFEGDKSNCMELAVHKTLAEKRNFCKLLQNLSEKLVGLNTDPSELASICSKYSINGNDSKSKSAMESWMRVLFPKSWAQADFDDPNKQLCEDYKSVKVPSGSDWANASSEPPDQLSSRQGIDLDTSDRNQRETGSSSRVEGSSGSQTGFRDRSTSRPIFTGDSARADSIREHLDRTDSVLDRSRSAADGYRNQLAKVVISPAQASESSIGLNTNNSSASSNRAPSDASSSVKSRLPDPLNPFSTVSSGAPGGTAGGRSAMTGTVSPQQAAIMAKISQKQVEPPRDKGAPTFSGQSSPSNHSGVTGSSGNPGSSRAPSAVDSKARQDEQAEFQKEWHQLKKRLLSSYAKVKKDLVSPEMVALLLRHKVQVVDDEERVYGSGSYVHRFVYDAKAKVKGLTLVETDREPASLRKRK